MIIANIVSYDFMKNALLAGSFIALLLPFIGIIIILRKQTFLADALGHINMSAIAFSIFITTTFSAFTDYSTFLIIFWSVLGAVLIEYLRNKFTVNKEVSLIIVYSLSIALTMIFLNLSSGYNASFFNVLFGNINAISKSDINFILVGGVIVFITIGLTYKKILLLSLEEEYAKMYGFNLTFYRYLTIIIITLVISMAIKVIGVLLVSSLLIIPLLGAMRIGNNLKMTLIYSILITEFAVVGGIIIAFYLNISTSAIIVLLALLIYGLSIIGFKNN